MVPVPDSAAVVAASGDAHLVADDLVDEPVLVGDAAIPVLREVAAGDTVVYDAQIDDANSVLSEGYYRWSGQETALLVTEVSFDRAQLPTRVDAFHRAHADGPDLRSHELALEHGDRVHLAQPEAAVGVHGIRWDWAPQAPCRAD